MAIPTVPGSEIEVSTPQRAARLDAGALTAPARAQLASVGGTFRGREEVAGAIGGAGEMIGGIEQDLLKAKRARIAADSDLKMRAAQQSFIESLRGDQNEEGWIEHAKETYDQVRDEIYSQGIPPTMRPEMDAAVRGWGQALQIKTATMAAVQSVNRAEVSVRKSYDESAKDGDAAGMANAVALGRSSKLDPAAMDELQQAIPATLAKNAIETGLANNPQGTYELLKSGASLPVADESGKVIVPKKALKADEFDNLLNRARVRRDEWQKVNAEQLLSIADPVTGFIPEDQIRSQMQSGQVSEAFGRNLISSQQRKQKALETEDRRQAAELSREAAKADRDAYNLVTAKVHDPTAWGVDPESYAKSLVEDAADISDPALRQRAMNEANHQLAAVKKTGETAERPVERQMYELMQRDLGEQSAMVPTAVNDVPEKPRGMFSAAKPAAANFTQVPGGLAAIRKMDDATVEATFGKGTKKEDVLREAEVHAARLQDEMRQWFQSPEGQKATFEQANEHRQKLERPWVMEAVRKTLSGRAPVDVTGWTEQQIRALPVGTRIVHGGRLGTIN